MIDPDRLADAMADAMQATMYVAMIWFGITGFLVTQLLM